MPGWGANNRTGALRAYRGERAEERAYQAGLWVAATQYGHQASRERYAEQFGSRDLHATTMSTTSNANGAYFVPDVLDLEILKLTEEYGVIRRYARNRPMSSDTWTGPRWTGVLTTTFVAEGTAPSQTEQTYDMISLVAKNLAAYGKMTRNLHEDALINLGDEWAEAAAIAFANKEDDCAFNGTGASTYGGITGLLTKVVAAANAASLFTATGHATLGALTLSDFWSVVGKFPSYPGASPMWFAHKEVYAASMGPLQTAAGGVTPQDIANGGIPRFLGYPVVPVNVMPAAASVTTGVTGILFGDLRLAVAFGDRRGVTFETGLINDDLIKQLMTLFCSERFDINCHTITDPKNSSNPGPVIGLKLG
jgi:HK97 family phage major capsid protein